MTYSDYITDALRAIGVLMYNESADANQGATGLRVFNNMMAQWAESGINVGYVPSETTTDDLMIDRNVRETVTANLAIRLSPFYPSAPVSQVTMALASSGYDKLLNKAINESGIKADMRGQHLGEGWYPRTRILTGS